MNRKRPGTVHTLENFKYIAVPVIWQLLYMLSTVLLWKRTLYLELLFLAGLIFWFRKDFSIDRFIANIRRGKNFWIPVAATAVALWLASFITDRLKNGVFMGKADGLIGVVTYNVFEIIIYTLMTIFLMPVAENLFYRRAILQFFGKKKLLAGFIIGTVLYALSHALGWIGLLEYCLIGIPLTVSYILTGNLYVAVMANMIVNLVEIAEPFATVLARIVLR